MNPITDELARAVAVEAGRELDDALDRIAHCLGQLTDEQVWWRPAEGMNSIGNLMLHVAGNLRQWIVSGVGGTEDLRNRPAEFAERGPMPKVELLRRVREAVGEAAAVLSQAAPAELLRVRRIQGFDVTGLGAVFHSVPHFRGHTQEIVHLTRAQLGDRYRFAWSPATPEEGAAE